MKDYSYRRIISDTPELGEQSFIVADDRDVKKLEERVNQLEKQILGLYDIIEELAKKI